MCWTARLPRLTAGGPKGSALCRWAVNLSRVTLRSPVAAGFDPGDPKPVPGPAAQARLELEITEQADAVGTETLHSLVAQFHSFGLRVSLDDFRRAVRQPFSFCQRAV